MRMEQVGQTYKFGGTAKGEIDFSAKSPLLYLKRNCQIHVIEGGTLMTV